MDGNGRISALLQARAAEHGSRPALIDEKGEISWAELDVRVRKTSAWLRSEGAAPGDHIALLCPNRPAYIVLWLAIADLGGVAVSVNVGLIGDALRYALTQSKPALVLAEQALADRMAGDIAPVIEDLPVLRFRNEADLDRLTGDFTAQPPGDGAGNTPVSIIYTSGTTGRPKGVLNSHTAFIACGRHTVDMLAVTRRDRIMLFLPLFHANPLMYGLMSALHSGAALVIRPKFSASAFFDDARRFGCTIFTYVGTVLAMLCNRVSKPDFDHSLTRGIGGGCPAETWQIMRDRFGVDVHELYGMTEIGGWVTANRMGSRRIGTCGQVRGDMDVRVVDPSDHAVPPGQQGEIVVRPRVPDVILSEYWDNPAATVAAMRNLWFHTGDVGSFDEDGFLTFHGRTKEIIRRGGENISPVDIELVALAHPDIVDAAALAQPDPVFGEEIRLCLVVGRSIDPAILLTFLQARLAPFMTPRYLQFVDHIPKTETQKIQRHLLAKADDPVIDLRAMEDA